MKAIMRLCSGCAQGFAKQVDSRDAHGCFELAFAQSTCAVCTLTVSCEHRCSLQRGRRSPEEVNNAALSRLLPPRVTSMFCFRTRSVARLRSPSGRLDVKQLKEAMFANEPRHSARFAINGLEQKKIHVVSQDRIFEQNRPSSTERMP